MSAPTSPDPVARKAATHHTVARQRDFAARLPADDRADFERAGRGLIARFEGPIAQRAQGALGTISWDTGRFAFVQGDAPDTVNPALWRQAKLNNEHGLFEVMDGVWQVRGYDTSCVTFVRGHEGWVVIDPLTVTETAATAKALVDEHLGVLPVKAVIYTHSHVDHYGGILGIVSRAEVESGSCQVVAPEGFMHAAVAENVVAQCAMGRRATYQYGMTLPWDEQGHVDQGLGKGIPTGSGSLVAPTLTVDASVTELVLDGVRIEFQLTPDSEAPAEMHFYFPDLRLLCLAENCTGTQHNVLTLRGALIRDSLAWSHYIDEAIARWGDVTDVSIASHSWPFWGRDDVVEHMRNHRDLYRWIHDEAMRLANLGYTPDEIAATVELPPGLWADWTCHGYYGTVSHNVRAVYQRYFGFYDGHPSSLEPHPPVDAAIRYVEFMGGMDVLLANARRSYDEGDYRWVAQVLRHAVFADPTNREARLLQADAFEQLGYVAEAGPWRDVYLTGAQDLRNGTPPFSLPVRPTREVIAGMTLAQVFDYLAVRLDGPAAVELGTLHVRWEIDGVEAAATELSNGTLHSRVGALVATAPTPDATVRCTLADLHRLVSTSGDLRAAIRDGSFAVTGDAERVCGIFERLTPFEMFFAVVEP